jgi:hypothetical protein
MKRLALLVALAAMLCGTEAGAYNINFDSVIDGPYSVHSEGGFNIFATGTPWSASSGIVSNNSATAQLMIQDVPVVSIDDKGDPVFDYAKFVFTSVDLSSHSGSTQFVITGYDDAEGSSILFVHQVILPDNTFGRISLNAGTVFNGCSLGIDCNIKRLTIAFNIPSSEYKIDNVCLSGGPCPTYVPPGGGEPNVPEPASLLLLGAGLAGIGIWRRKAAKLG